MSNRLHLYTWDGRVRLYFYLGPIRFTLFNSVWIFGKRRHRTPLRWALHYIGRTIILGIILGIPGWYSYQHPYWILDALTSIARRFH